MFVSHAYDYRFMKVVETLRAWERSLRAHHDSEGDTAAHGTLPFPSPLPDTIYYYFDLFTVNQHGQAGVVDFEELAREFGGGVRGIGRTLLVLDWGNPVALTRAWCIYEIFTSLDVRAAFEVSLCPTDGHEFTRCLLTAFEEAFLKTCSVDAEQASALEKRDLDGIQAAVRAREGGFLAVNRLIIGAMRAWMISTCMRVLKRMEADHSARPDFMYNTAKLLHKHGDMVGALPLYELSLELRRSRYGPEDRRTLAGMAGLARLLQELGRLDEAEKLYKEDLEICRRVLGPAHKDTLHGIANMARLLHDRGKLAEAEKLFREDLAGSKLALGEEHNDTLSSMHNLAQLLLERREYDEAEGLLEQVLRIRSTRLPPDALQLLTCKADKVKILQARGDLDAAQALCESVLAARKRILGDEHPHTLNSLCSLGRILVAAGKLDAAEPHFREDYDASSRRFGCGHPDTATSALHLVDVLRRLPGRSGDAIHLCSKTLRHCREWRALGIDHPLTLTCMRVMAKLLRDAGDAEAAEAVFRDLVALERISLPDDDRARQSTLLALARLQRDLRDDSAGAAATFRELATLQRRVYGDAHKTTHGTLRSLCRLLQALGQHEEEREIAQLLVAAPAGMADDSGLASNLASPAGGIAIVPSLSTASSTERP